MKFLQTIGSAGKVLLLLFSLVNAEPRLLQEYRVLLQNFPRHYEEVATNGLSVDAMQPLWRIMKKTSPKSFLHRIWGDNSDIDPSQVVDRLLAQVYGRGNMPRLRKYSYRRLIANPGDRIVVIGYTGGSLYSFVQILLDLVVRSVIDDEMRLQDPHTYLVFTGDFSSPSPYWLYSLHLLATIMEQNPGQCIVLRGKNERLGYWESFDTVRAYLKGLAAGFADRDIPFSDEFNAFYNSLPDGLFVRSALSGQELVFSNHLLPHQDIAHPTLCSWISGGFDQSLNVGARGFGFERFRSGVAQWALLSAPDFIVSNQMSGYLEIVLPQDFEKCLGVYRYAPRTTLGVPFHESLYALVYGFELRNPSDFKRLENARREFVCSTVDLSGGTALVGDSVARGVEYVLVNSNQDATCPSILFRHVVFDDQYTPDKALENVNTFIDEYHASYVLAPQGSPTLSAYIDKVRNKEFAVLFTESGGTQFRTPDIPFIINLRPSFAREIDALLAYLFSRYKIAKFAAVYQDDAFGVPLVEASKNFIQAKKPEVVFDALGYVRGQASFADVNELIRQSNGEAIAYFITSSGPAQGFFGGDMAIFLKGRHVLLVLVDESILHVLKRFGISALYSSSVPNPWDSDIPMVARYREVFQEARKPLSVHSLLGFISGTLFIDGAQRLIKEGKQLQGAEFVALYQAYQNVEILGMTFSFDPLIRSFNLPVWIHQEDGSWTSNGSGEVH